MKNQISQMCSKNIVPRTQYVSLYQAQKILEEKTKTSCPLNSDRKTKSFPLETKFSKKPKYFIKFSAQTSITVAIRAKYDTKKLQYKNTTFWTK